jgi:hypothetical protein
MTFYDKYKHLLKLKKVVEEKPKEDIRPVFDPKYKTVIRCECGPMYLEMLEWVNNNSSGSVDAKFEIGFGHGIDVIYLGFENKDDALVFKIKYSA